MSTEIRADFCRMVFEVLCCFPAHSVGPNGGSIWKEMTVLVRVEMRSVLAAEDAGLTAECLAALAAAAGFAFPQYSDATALAVTALELKLEEPIEVVVASLRGRCSYWAIGMTEQTPCLAAVVWVLIEPEQFALAAAASAARHKGLLRALQSFDSLDVLQAQFVVVHVAAAAAAESELVAVD